MLFGVDVLILLIDISLIGFGFYQTIPLLAIFGIMLVLILWILAKNKSLQWMATVNLFCCVLLGGFGILIRIYPIIMGNIVLFGLISWDLNSLSHRLRSALMGPDKQSLIKMHLFILLILAILSFFFMSLVTLIHMTISFGWIFLIIIVLFLLLGKISNLLKKNRG